MTDLPPAIIDKEFMRLIERAYKKKDEKLDETSLQTIEETIELWSYFRPFKKFLNFLDIMVFITRESK